MLNQFLKTLFDIIVAIFLLVLLCPLMVAIALLIRVKLGKPILFRQERVGKSSKSFTLYKFRTMTFSTDHNGSLLPAEHRVTKLGRFLRKTSVDELPQLINVVKGEMSLIGPRPHLPQFLLHYTEEEQVRHHVRPGLSGWAQVNGRNLTPWDERMAMDLWYVKNQSFWLDFKILLLTIIKVVSRQGVVEITVEDFDMYRQRKQQQQM